jgi:TetR/AcrR family transcriptional regulator, tetracycline repressor protein
MLSAEVRQLTRLPMGKGRSVAAIASSQGAGRRRQGVKAGLDLARILEVASSIAPDDLTMQAVADKLGVDRKAINHHVSDRESLLRLVAIEGFARSVAEVRIPADTDWREASRIFGRAVASGVTALGALAPHLQVGTSADEVLLAATEALLAKYVEAGLDLETAVRAVSMLGDICEAHGQGVARMAIYGGAGIRDEWLREVLRERSGEQPRYLGQVAHSPIDTYDERQLDLSVEIFIAGLEGLISA